MIHKNQYNLQSDPKAQQEVAKWVVRLSDGYMKDSDLQAFQEWRRAKPENALAFEEAQELWQSDELTRALSSFDLSQSCEAEEKKGWGIRYFFLPLAYASIFLCLIGLTTLYWPQINSDYASLTGEIKQVQLEDGTIIHLDSKSALNVDFSAKYRNATLKQGRIYFDVQRNTERPFIIQAKSNAIRVLGTAFDVDIRHNETLVLVREGRVEVSEKKSDKPQIVLTAGQGARFSASGKLIKKVKASSFNWLKKRIHFQNQSVAEVVNELNEYTYGQIIVANDEIASKRITGSYSLTDIDKALSAISEVISGQLIGSSTVLAIIH